MGAGLALALGYVLWRGWVHRGHLVDDAFIGLRYAANLLAGRGLVFNPGEAVEGVTNLGWVVLVAGTGWAAPVGLPWVAKALGAACLAAAVALVAAAHRRLAPEASPWEVALLPVLVVAQPETLYFSLAGMETGLAALLLAGMLRCVLGERPRLALAAVLAGLLVTVRPETVVLLPAYLALAAVPWLRAQGGAPAGRRPFRRALLGAAALFAALVLAVTLFRLAYYGAPLPNTYLAKGPAAAADVLGQARDLLLGRNPHAPPPFGGVLFLTVAAYGAWSLRRRPLPALLLAAAAGTGLAFAVYARPDWTGTGRYFAPYAPLATLLLLRGLFVGAGSIPRLGRPAATALAAAVGVLLVGVGLYRTREHLGPAARGDYPGFVLTSETLADPARRTGALLPVGTTVAARRIGALAYYSDLPVLDYAWGLTDPRVARLVAREGRVFESPAEAALARLWREAAPGCLLEDGEVTAGLRDGPGPDGELAVHGLRYEEVRRFTLGDGAATWVLACRPDLGA